VKFSEPTDLTNTFRTVTRTVHTRSILHMIFFVQYTGCEGYWRPFLKVVWCSSRMNNHEKNQAVDPFLALLHRASVYFSATINYLPQESLRGAVFTWNRAEISNSKLGCPQGGIQKFRNTKIRKILSYFHKDLPNFAEIWQ
jgi:hypothetical protein